MGEINRRSFLRRTAVAGGAILALEGLMASNKLRSLSGGTRAYAQTGSGGYGPLIPQ
ncbi:MAG: twin-arginine translocation signal domain-containing protein, partial [Pyrinomonadaceae bacterium]|nr:twin-arginine translocation signal domain-containing protein [Pyrinomonadaceae bacterium]